ncbi:MAG TPA: ACT domain-containing protein [Firmicutes bacterium]|uniref:Prephenate dehydratase n=1 Tax=Capillibacterium thermochitinicola TaxID=2699427 RepID=A0A8J6LLS7_9FIRM|nr:prephenate dehydratase domain-containing protein [Capillibacterium thermochitinicola]MBA2132709.1 ACT domain-containing protein [Capillibacterium thermochitinicola]HHW12712.1 ACT domain-containing protein [Bacillota bacterium]
MQIVTLGPKGTFSEEAALLYQKRILGRIEPEKIKFSNIYDCLQAVESYQADRAVLPAENMVDGIIGITFDALIEFHDFIKVNDEVHVSIQYVLAGKLDHPEKVEQIFSHPSALNQCAQNLETLFPAIVPVPVASTAEAAVKAAEEPGVAALCSPRTAREYGLHILHENLADYPGNETRFFVCGLTDHAPTGNDRTLLAVRFGVNRPGQLHEITGFFAENGIDLTFVQSRPYKVRPQEYVLLFEAVGHKSEPRLKKALHQVEQTIRKTNGWKKVLGSYPHRQKEENGLDRTGDR